MTKNNQKQDAFQSLVINKIIKPAVEQITDVEVLTVEDISYWTDFYTRLEELDDEFKLETQELVNLANNVDNDIKELLEHVSGMYITENSMDELTLLYKQKYSDLTYAKDYLSNYDPNLEYVLVDTKHHFLAYTTKDQIKGESGKEKFPLLAYANRFFEIFLILLTGNSDLLETK